jgi:hypothetical protein
MKVNNQTFLHTTLLLVIIIYFGFLIYRTIPDYNLVAYGQNQSSSFQAGVNAIDNMPAQRVKVGDIDIAYKMLGNESSVPIILIARGGTTMDMWNPTLLGNDGIRIQEIWCHKCILNLKSVSKVNSKII